jgi:sigma-B regulation protein RsbU (phosphoserine phosphatase)
MNPFHSLRTQLCAGAIALLGVTVLAIGYFLIEHEKRILTGEIEKTVVLQGRNIALGSEKALLRTDPEFELFPLVRNLLASSESIRSVVITDADGVVCGHSELQNLSRVYRFEPGAYARSASRFVSAGEALFENDDAFVLKTPVESSDKTVGYVYLTYSKTELRRLIRKAVAITLMVSAVALSLAALLSLLLFRRISEPMARLIEGVRKLGDGDLSAHIKLKTRNEFQTLAEAFNDMTRRIAAAQDELVVKERMQRELEIAREIQETLIPKKVHQPEGYEVALYCEPATEVGGDYIDVIEQGSGVVVVMADVSGKGVPGLVVMGMLKIMVQALVRRGMGPLELMKDLNVSLKKTLKPNMFVTLFVARLDPALGELVYSNAGHNPMVIYDRVSNRGSFHKMAGPPLGIFPARIFNQQVEEYSLRMDPGALVVQYTDGLNESMNDKGEQFGLERVMSVCDAYGSEGAAAIVPRLARAELSFRRDAPQPDDIALLALGAKERVGSFPAGVAD